jgi:hypothetical protein
MTTLLDDPAASSILSGDGKSGQPWMLRMSCRAKAVAEGLHAVLARRDYIGMLVTCRSLARLVACRLGSRRR